MARADILTAINTLQNIVRSNQEHGLVPSVELMSHAIKTVMDAMVKTQRSLQSDPNYKLERGCERKCGYTAQSHTCGRAECEHPESD